MTEREIEKAGGGELGETLITELRLNREAIDKEQRARKAERRWRRIAIFLIALNLAVGLQNMWLNATMKQGQCYEAISHRDQLRAVNEGLGSDFRLPPLPDNCEESAP